jgi:hypothetical protein
MDERPMEPDDATQPRRARQRSIPTQKPATFDDGMSASSFDNSRFTPGTLLAGR